MALPRSSLPLTALAMIYGIVGLAGFFAPYSYETQNRPLALAPPTHIHFLGEDRRFHIRPFVYRWKSRRGSLSQYEEDRTVALPLRFFVSGEPYSVAGWISSRTHLFGTGPEAHVFLLGTDGYGRDLLSRLLYGGQLSLLAGLLAAGISVSFGIVLGGLAGYYGTWTDSVIMRTAELFLALPWLYLLLAIRAFLPLQMDPAGVFLLLIAVSGLVGWARPARLVRGVVLSGRDREYVLAAKGFGASDIYILRRHVLPQTYSVVLTQAGLYVPQYITAEVVLSFFGLGVSEPVPSWGNMLAQLQNLFVLEFCWWMYAPAATLVGVMTIFWWALRSSSTRL